MNKKEIENLFEQEIDNQLYQEIKDVVAYIYRLVFDERTQILLPVLFVTDERINIYNRLFSFSFEISKSEIIIFRNKGLEIENRKVEGNFSVKKTLFETLKLAYEYILKKRTETEKIEKIKRYSDLFNEMRKELDDTRTVDNLRKNLEIVSSFKG